MMLRRSGSASSVAAHAALVGLCATAVGLSCPHTMSALADSRRSFFNSGSPGSDLLRHFTSPAEPTKAFSPLDKLRPPAPPSASDAQPFGSLNRTNQLRRYVNVNTDSVTLNGTTTTTAVGDSSSSNASPAGGAAGSFTAATSSHSQMDLSRLVRRHARSPTSPALSSAPSAAVSASPFATAAPVAVETSPSSSAPTTAVPAGSFGGAAVTSTHATVAKAQAVIAAAEQQQQQQLNARDGERRRSETANTANTSFSPSAQACAIHTASPRRQHSQVYKEHCYIGWSPEEFYRVVADVEHYTDFLPWCAGSEVHTARRVRVPRGSRLLAGNEVSTSAPTPEATVATPRAAAVRAVPGDAALTRAAVEAELVDAIAMTATLTIGFSFLKEQYTSRVTLYPGTKIVAALYDDEDADAAATAAAAAATAGGARASSPPSRPSVSDSFVVSLFKKAASTAGAAAKRSILKHLLCEWEFCPVPGKPNMVEVVFSVSFEFKNPLHSHMVMSNVVALMTRSFERRCESLYGPPSASKESLPLFF